MQGLKLIAALKTKFLLEAIPVPSTRARLTPMKAPQTHHRALTDFTGRISNFQSSRQMLQAVYDAYLAHMHAFSKCGTLHRDVSIHNILLSKDGTGFLNDWDMAHGGEYNRDPVMNCRPTGTWFFMSMELLGNSSHLHELQDDLESFCYVVVYLALRYLPRLAYHHVPDLSMIMKEFFDHHYFTTGSSDGELLGGSGKVSLVHCYSHSKKMLQISDNEALTSWIKMALRAVKDWSRYLNQSLDYVAPETSPTPMELKDRPLRNHEGLAQIFQTTLAETWPQNDKAVDHLPTKGNCHSRYTYRRRRDYLF